jgi:hypothetical protein
MCEKDKRVQIKKYHGMIMDDLKAMAEMEEKRS